MSRKTIKDIRSELDKRLSGWPVAAIDVECTNGDHLRWIATMHDGRRITSISPMTPRSTAEAGIKKSGDFIREMRRLGYVKT